jgi:hypothetical protein
MMTLIPKLPKENKNLSTGIGPAKMKEKKESNLTEKILLMRLLNKT